MNYEEKYKEALERAKKLHDSYNLMHISVDEIEQIFPELAESEDERIMSRIIDGFKNFSRSASKWNNIPVEEVIAYLEKQKENPKSTDSIPSDCISDAKCEDRWHKVGDSLPDNPREVLCKDEAGNYFIGRYYVGEGWEISNYDDEDKPHHLNPPVSKWIDFPLEKQKDLTTENIYKHSRERMSFWNGQQEEQKPAEYGDEFIAEAEEYASKVNCGAYKVEVTEAYIAGALRANNKPAEWSEEDEACIRILESIIYYDKKLPNDTRVILGEFLSNLRPQPKRDCKDCAMFLNGKCTKPHWKPSEVCYGPTGDPDPAGTSDLEEAAEEYVSKTLCDPNDGPSTGLAKESFIAGAEWQKEQMMKEAEAVEGFIFQSEDYYPKELVAQYNGELKHGDKVKIIIVKK